MARIDGEAPSTGWDALQTRVTGRVRLRLDWLELWLEQQRDQLPLWLPVMLGAGIGTLGSTFNAFATVIASNAAGVPFTA